MIESGKRGRSEELPYSNKRQQTSVGLERSPREPADEEIGALLNIIPGKDDERIPLYSKDVTTIGRSRACDIILQEPDISTIHCELRLVKIKVDSEDKKLINIVDKSRNGTFLNGNRLVKKDQILRQGDKIVLGKSCSFLFKESKTNWDSVSEDLKLQQSDEDNVTRGELGTPPTVFKKPMGSFVPSQDATRLKAKMKKMSFFDKYLLGKELGAGHYAIVKEGTNKATGDTVAVKIFQPQQNDDEKKSKQFREETSILMSIHHPNIVNMLDSFVEPLNKAQIQKYLVLEKVDDGELFERIVKKTSLRQDETKAIFQQIMTGLKYLHGQNIIHRDIKPENILLNITRRTSPVQIQSGPWDEDEIDIKVKIADFGLAKFTGEMQFANTLCGTPSYVAPEVLMKTEYDAKVDMWSAGVILYVCLCGFPPFSDQLGPPSLKEQILQAKYAFYTPYWDNIDDSILHLISNLLVRDPKKRYDVDAVFAHQWMQSSGINTRVDSSMERLQLTDDRLPKTYTELSCL
ncbi:serine/threonine protein kinase DUN1 KNAG_0A05670 [Huiozyma naganishii CBS 8797]|uniref:DNA damage response protein kinase DUN1 n=1 Tax=Huiozyma naganishii (strain ATCC MYA-139 / BCRC 22969 / CBS 8797 / KCTC 17520 / NBRC 10181 / NCYC 3082 / Yp74L-3) TaxID=1071383 RepID=J7S3W6_HUIN7|nr:hypothetical protein KNAG_0A05670 [Kazachstania naganishii CBS 8797]CCK68231.1 hypothetical protein KNAG_0A05670 [Kazachstania naganishii CBS 8797]